MNEVDYSKPIELVKGDEVKAAEVDPAWNGAGSPPIWPADSLFAVSLNMLSRIGWRVRNKGE